MKQISNKQAQRNRAVAKIKSELPLFCAICGRRATGDGAHLLPKSVWPEHYTEPRNLVRLCRECHRRYDNDIGFRKQQVKLIRQVQSFDKLAANRYFKLYETDYTREMSKQVK